jgi:hypothetical protein
VTKYFVYIKIIFTASPAKQGGMYRIGCGKYAFAPLLRTDVQLAQAVRHSENQQTDKENAIRIKEHAGINGFMTRPTTQRARMLPCVIMSLWQLLVEMAQLKKSSTYTIRIFRYLLRTVANAKMLLCCNRRDRTYTKRSHTASFNHQTERD